MELGCVCVFCGSSPGGDRIYADAAESLGSELGRRGIRLVYGGGRVGLMGILADAALGSGGEVNGVITRSLKDKEIAHLGLTSLRVVASMHERKAAKAAEADVFVMLPGGFGTLDEFFEAVTWTQLGIHSKACGILNVGGFFDPLLELFEAAVRSRFIRPEHRDNIIVEHDPSSMLERLATSAPLTFVKWIDTNEVLP